jgi:hypothetical protein
MRKIHRDKLFQTYKQAETAAATPAAATPAAVMTQHIALLLL